MKPDFVRDCRAEGYTLKSDHPKYKKYWVRYDKIIDNGYCKGENLELEGLLRIMKGNQNHNAVVFMRIEKTDRLHKIVYERVPKDLTDRLKELPPHVRVLLKSR